MRRSEPLKARSRTGAALVFAATVAWGSPALADYRIGAGDVLSITVAGLPDMATKATVDMDGAAPVPLVGQVSFAGLSVAEALAKVRAVLPTREFRRHTDDGREYPVIVSPDEIGLTIFEYRPVYLSGDVAHPGAEAYRPGLTVRQAIALAGGYDVLRYKMDNPFLQLADLTGEYNGLWIDYAKRQALVGRLRAELDGKAAIDEGALIGTPVASGVSGDIIRNEQEQLTVRNADFDKEQVYLREAAAKEDDRAKVLGEQQSKEQDGVTADAEDLQRYTDLFKKGAVALPVLTDARRTVLLSSTRALQTTAVLDSVEREQQELVRKLDRTGAARQTKLLEDLQAASTDLAATRARLQAVSEKLRYTGMVKSQLVRGNDSRPKITVVRTTEGKRSEVSVGVDAELQPGDAIEVALQVGEPVPISQ